MYTLPLLIVLALAAFAAVVIGDRVSKLQSQRMGALIVGPLVMGVMVAVIIMASPFLVAFAVAFVPYIAPILFQ